ncbi:acyl carrier protein [Methylobacterium marchantiae]|uniref:Acyl carrier protein n=1 Tax=Methylobacterium marchantiae TaxID=600331 RepID=A0ABW3X651_9HYPH|nr:Acyl carrier protein [Methylobacterium marchantiae]
MVETKPVEAHAAAREAILAFIAGRNPGLAPGAVTDATSLVTSDALDSIGVLDLMMELGDQFGFDIEEDAFELAHFESVDALAAFVEAKRVRARP